MQKMEAKVDGRTLKMELEIGAPVSEKTLCSIKTRFLFQKSDRQFTNYTRHKISCLGGLPVQMTLGEKKNT